MKAAFVLKASKKHPPPSPFSSDCTEPELSFTTARSTFSENPNDISPESLNGEDGSSAFVAAQEKALVTALIDSKTEDYTGASDVVPVPFGTHKPVWAAKVFP